MIFILKKNRYRYLPRYKGGTKLKKTVKFIIAFLFIITLVGCGGNNHEGEAKTPSGSSDQKGRDYEEVIDEFEEQGFTNVKTAILDDLITGWLIKDGEVESVSVDGDEDYSSDTWYPNNVEVIVTYHTFREKETKEKSHKTENETKDEKKNKEKNKTKNELSNDKNEQDSQETDDESLKIYESAVGKPAFDVFNELEALGFNVSLSHAITKMDFSTSILYESDPTDVASYIPWIITDLDSYNGTSKSASFFINTQEMIDETDAKETQKDALDAKLDLSMAWGAMEVYGKKEYPNGFKLKMVTGMLAETAEDENTWFLKTKCKVKNYNGTWVDYVCEARVSGTTNDPQIIYFDVY